MKIKSVLGGIRKKMLNVLEEDAFNSLIEPKQKDVAEDLAYLWMNGTVGWKNMDDDSLLKAYKEQLEYYWSTDAEDDDDVDHAMIHALYDKAVAKLAMHRIVLGG